MIVINSAPKKSPRVVFITPASFKNLVPGNIKEPQPIIEPNTIEKTSNLVKRDFISFTFSIWKIGYAK